MPASRHSSPKLLLTVVATCCCMQAAQAGSLLECLDEALAADPLLRIETQRAALQRENFPQARAVLLPSLRADGRIGSERVSLPGQDVSGWQDARTRGVSIAQTLLSAEAWQSLRAARLDVEAADHALEAARQQLLLRVAEGYFRVLSAAEQLRTSRAASAAFGELLRQAQVREESGLGTRSAVTQSQAFFDTTLQPVIDAGNFYEDALRGLAQITGTFRASVASLPEETPLPGVELASVDDWMARLRDDNPLLSAQLLAARAAQRRVSAERATLLPVLVGDASFARVEQDMLPGGARNVHQLGIAVSLPLFEGGAKASRVRAARAGAEQADAEYDLAVRMAERELRRAWRAVNNGLSRVQVARRTVESTRDSVEAARTNVEFGTGSEFDLLQAQNQHFVARRVWQQARLDFLLETLRLELQAGQLAVDDLARIDALLTGAGEDGDAVP